MNKVIILFAFVSIIRMAQASPLPDYPFVFTQGQAQTELKPNLCKVDFRIKIRDEAPEKALLAVEKRSREVLKMLSEHGIKKEDIIGFEITKDRVRNHEARNQLEFIGYEIYRRINFTIRDLATYESILTLLLKTPDVVDIISSFDRLNRKEVESSLLADAVSDAKSKAEMMAEASGQTIIRLKAISQNGFYQLGAHFGLGIGEYDNAMYSMGSSNNEDLLFVPSTIEFYNSVSLLYEIQETP